MLVGANEVEATLGLHQAVGDRNGKTLPCDRGLFQPHDQLFAVVVKVLLGGAHLDRRDLLAHRIQRQALDAVADGVNANFAGALADFLLQIQA